MVLLLKPYILLIGQAFALTINLTAHRSEVGYIFVFRTDIQYMKLTNIIVIG